MNSFRHFLTLIFFCLTFFPLSALADLDEIMLNQETMPETRQRSAVFFPHGLHMDNLECLDCHHVYEGGKNLQDEDELYEDNPDIRCQDCHNTDASIDTTKAFHHQCMGCHIKSTKEQAKIKTPEMCGDCHTNKN
ncbi:TmcA2 [Desulforapulum autotrophicum HRM2]|uniref:TmcA2 n=1 Tax=Desulforapulum autotrophicum (strain ATCC 43914 / DSM 3382 / VKM B-1955 / HRM2) TaxID=177437 RepID=C0QF53_DESAH|nr:cytochrome c3 family protein [Desulforapulum autotrophicum]ACN17554.1 TmcA2 [Desulforapulum autotrophicum HRM2]